MARSKLYLFFIAVLCLSLLVGCSNQPSPSNQSVQPAPINESPIQVSDQAQNTEPEEQATETKPKESEAKPQSVEPPTKVKDPKLEKETAEQTEQNTEATPSTQKTAPTPAAAPQVKAQPAPPQEEVKAQTVTLSITGDQQQVILGATSVVLEEGDNVLAVLKRITREKKIQMEYTGSGTFAYVQGINNLYEFDKGPKSGWMYRVNGVFGGKSAGALPIKAGDRIEWLYTEDLGKDLGKGIAQ